MRDSLVRAALVSLSLGLCSTPFVATAADRVVNCPAGQVARGIDFKNQTLSCVPLPNVAELQAIIAQLQEKLGCMTKTGDDVYFTGCNVHVRNGLGGTGPNVNGLGNLIVGYNEDASVLPVGEGQPPNDPSVRTGSHNLVVGVGHTYTNRGGLVTGSINKITARYATVTGGGRNIASGEFSTVSGGIRNTASGISSSVSGGQQNSASAPFASVSGGVFNQAGGAWSSVSGGNSNIAGGESSSVSGGIYNQASGSLSSVSGGNSAQASGNTSSVSGGVENKAIGDMSSVSGGRSNVASEFGTSVSGGLGRNALDIYDWVAGGLIQDQ